MLCLHGLLIDGQIYDKLLCDKELQEKHQLICLNMFHNIYATQGKDYADSIHFCDEKIIAYIHHAIDHLGIKDFILHDASYGGQLTPQLLEKV